MIVFSHIYARIKLFYDNSMTLIQENQTKHKKTSWISLNPSSELNRKYIHHYLNLRF